MVAAENVHNPNYACEVPDSGPVAGRLPTAKGRYNYGAISAPRLAEFVGGDGEPEERDVGEHLAENEPEREIARQQWQ